MRKIGTWVLESFGVLVATFILVMIMSWGGKGGAAGLSSIEVGIALAIVIGSIMIHRLTEAVRKVGSERTR
jgi:hypothetical protein